MPRLRSSALVLLAVVAAGASCEPASVGADAVDDAGADVDAAAIDAAAADVTGDRDSAAAPDRVDAAIPSDSASNRDAGLDAAALQPDQLDPCANGSCWQTSAASPRCNTVTSDEDFSSGRYNVHAYATSLRAATPTRLHLARTGGTWQPALLIAAADGTMLSDGERGLVADGLAVTIEQDGRSGDQAAVVVHSDVARSAVIYVTSWNAVDSDFVEMLPTDATYTLALTSLCDSTAYRPCVVNGHDVTEPACGWLHYVGWEVVPRLQGTRDERLTAAARVAWWSLKEGVMGLSNPIVYSNCNFTTGDQRIGPLETCAAGRAWQVGLSAVQVWVATLAEAEATASALFPTQSVNDVLATTAAEALLDADTSAAVVASTGNLRLSWLMRTSAIGFAYQAGPVTSECIDRSLSWCYGTGWTTSALYAPDRAGAMQSIADLRALFDLLAP